MIFIKEATVHDKKFNPQKLQKLNNPDRLKDIPPDYIMGKLDLKNPGLMLKEAYRLLKPGGKICIVDWLKKEMEQGPPAEIRYFPRDVKAQLVQAGFGNVKDYLAGGPFCLYCDQP
jgi:SAM-dependent methyltransferase